MASCQSSLIFKVTSSEALPCPLPLEPLSVLVLLNDPSSPFHGQVLLGCLFRAFLLQQEGMVLTQKERLRAIIQHSHLG